jgi:hypothetical protein
MTTKEKTTAKSATLLVVDPSNQRSEFQISDQESLIVGRNATCSIQLDDESVSERHCMFRFADGEVKLNDWHSASGTIVNGESISTDTSVYDDDMISVGIYQMQIKFDGDSQQRNTGYSSQSESGRPEEITPPVEQKSSIVADQLRLQLDQVTEENQQLRDELEELLNLVPKPEPAAVFSTPYEGFQNEEVEMLRAEVAQLQSELVQRDVELAELAAAENFSENTPAADPDTEALVERLEQLLDELQGTDRRIQSLQDLLRASDDAQQAELEERRQIANWLQEIEQRVSQRESEWKAENQKLTNEIEQLKTQRESAEQKLGKALQASGVETARQAEKHLAEIREENHKLAQQLQQQIQENEKLGKAADLVEVHGNGQSTEKIYQELRRQELELAQERATMSRQRAEVVRLKDEVERSAQKVTGGSDSSDLRVKALRDHLREIHEQEQEEKQNQPESPNGIASRIARLWQRLDSR